MNPKKEIDKSLDILNKGGVILYPTDTVWGIGCDATNYEAVKKIYEIKKRNDKKSMICLVSSIEMLKKHVQNIPPTILNFLNKTTKPTTIIYKNPLNISKNLISDDNSIAIRVINNSFCQNLIDSLNKPLVSTSANLSGKKTPTEFKEIKNDILKGVDYVVNLNKDLVCKKASSIIKFSENGEITFLRY